MSSTREQENFKAIQYSKTLQSPSYNPKDRASFTEFLNTFTSDDIIDGGLTYKFILQYSLISLLTQTIRSNRPVGSGHEILDGRLPTLYFKVKVHKADFQQTVRPNTHIDQPFLYSETQVERLYACSRPIVNHTACITTAIQKSAFLTSDIFETIEKLTKPFQVRRATYTLTYSPPTPRGSIKIYTADIVGFYPSTPHELILNAFDCFSRREPMNITS